MNEYPVSLFVWNNNRIRKSSLLVLYYVRKAITFFVHTNRARELWGARLRLHTWIDECGLGACQGAVGHPGRQRRVRLLAINLHFACGPFLVCLTPNCWPTFVRTLCLPILCACNTEPSFVSWWPHHGNKKIIISLDKSVNTSLNACYSTYHESIEESNGGCTIYLHSIVKINRTEISRGVV